MKHIYKGAFHLHSLYSDGTGTIEEIAKDAKKAGLDWIIITDHNSLEGFRNGEEGWYDGLAVIIGNEISPNESNHYLTAGITQEISTEKTPEEIIQEVKSQGGIGFIAHPDESTTRRNKFPPLRWENWSIRGFDGIEIWNYMSDWTDNYNEKIGVYCALARNYIVKGPSKTTLKWWDKINNETHEIVVAIGGLDSHAFDFGLFKIFPYHDTFKTVTNYLFMDEKLPKDFAQAKKEILNALKHGQNIIVNRVWNKKSKDNDLYFGIKDGYLKVKTPKKSLIKIYKNGEKYTEKITDKIKLEIEDLPPGKYRFEAYYKGKPWIFSNPVLI